MKKEMNNQLENLTEGQLKAIALMQFNSEDFFICDGKIYEGEENAAREQWEPAKEDYETFEDFCNYECAEVEEIDGDEEKDGYIVLTDEEADEKAADYIKDSLWAFNADFIIQHSKLPLDAKEMIESYQRDKCESANDTIEALIEDMDEFISDAIGADGRGHFLNTYDGNENEEEVNGTTFYIYRVN